MVQMVITTAGRQAVINAKQTGTNAVTISKIGVGSGKYTPAESQTILQQEIKRLKIVEGGSAGDNSFHVAYIDESTDAYSIFEFGLFLEDGTLFAVYSSQEAVMQKTSSAVAYLTVDVALENMDVQNISFGDVSYTTAAATTENAGIVALATDEEVKAGTSSQKALTPKSLNSLTASDGQAGLVELATNDETIAGADASRAVTPSGVSAHVKNVIKNVEIDSSSRIANSGGNGTFSLYPSGVSTFHQERAGTNQLALARFTADENGNSIVFFKSRSATARNSVSAIKGDKVGQINFLVDNGNINYNETLQGARAAAIEGGVFASSSLDSTGTTNIGVRGYLALYCCSDENSRNGKGLEIIDNAVRPTNDDAINLGTAGRRWKAVYAMTDVISTSDENQKQDIADIPDAVLTAWGNVNFKQFHFKADVLADGEDAKLYCGVIAQQIMSAFTAAGLDACAYGLVCTDTDDEGNTIYGVRYREALVMEAAYQRKKIAALEARIAALESA
nr:MAG TPA: LONG TAIL FIBER PROTEIN [Caudoviricetes sp.]